MTETMPGSTVFVVIGMQTPGGLYLSKHLLGTLAQ
ncbi:enoyl-CoA hydratase [Mycolicibacterium monacense DSM 44395]|nr:enoyl-CoA hydratase [Mycolicibacterium monacense DSM 44395]